MGQMVRRFEEPKDPGSKKALPKQNSLLCWAAVGIQKPSETIKFSSLVNSNNNIIRHFGKEARFRIFDKGGKLVDEMIIQ